MAKLLHCLLFVLLFNQILIAQCPPPGFPQPGNNCPQAPILCENLDGYCATINNNNMSQNFPGCPGFSLNNDEWFAFYAGTTTITMVITPSNCLPGGGGNLGMQAAIYAGCGPPWITIDNQCSCTQNPFTLTANNFVVGQIYWIVVDGCSGSVCDYAVDVTVGSTVGAPPATPGTITGPANACAGGTSSFTIPPATGATSYSWTLTPPIGTVTGTGTTANVTWGTTAPATTQLCVTASNQCYSNPTPSCTTVNLVPLPTATLSGSGAICNSSSAPVPLTVTFTGEAPWTFLYRINGVLQPSITTSTNPYTINATQVGNYTLQSVVSTTGNCTGTVSGTAAVTQVTVNATTTVVNAQCGQSNGSVNLTVTGGAMPYTFVWSGTQTTEDLSNMPGGTYTVTVTEAGGCTRTATATVADNPINFTITPTITANTTCTGGNGAISVAVSPSGTYTYVWSNSETTQSITNLTPGSYTVTVTTGVNCTQTSTINVPNNPNAPNATLTATASTCGLDNGAVNLTVSGGVTPYTFDWATGQTTEDLSGIPAGSYQVTVTGANGCTDDATVTVNNNNPNFTINQNTTPNTNCNATGNGSVTLTVTPSGTYTYIWDGGETTNTLTNLLNGSYTVTVSAGGTCTQVATVNINQNPNNPTISFTTTPTTCDLPNGSINVSVSGGVTPYSFLWDNGAVTEDLSNIAAGSYNVTVTGANGCTDDATINLSNNNPPINISVNTQPNTTCTGGNGSATITVTPAGTYTFEWSTTATTQNISGLAPGSYSVTVFGNGSCTQTATVNINDNPNNPNLTSSTTTATCDLNNGSINVSVSGGVAPYTFLWGGGQTTEDLTGIPGGSYDVTVTGANGCTDEANINLNNNNPPFNINDNVFANTSCNATPNGSITIIVTPSGSYTYIWSNSNTTTSLTGLAAGTYTVTVSAGGSCVQELEVEVVNDPIEPVLSSTVVNARCGLNNGSINLSVNGGVQPYTYMWASGQTTQDLNNIPAGFYDVTVTGANGCSSIEIVSVEDDQINISLNETIISNSSCTNIKNGSISLSVIPSAITTLIWSNSATTTTISNLAPGDYTVTVSAGGTCTEVMTYTVDDFTIFPIINGEITPAFCDVANGAIDLTIEDGVTPYTIKWSNLAMSADLNNILAGTYTVTVTTARGCSETATFNVSDNDLAITIFSYIEPNTSCGLPNGSLDLDIFPPGYNYVYKWSNNAMTPFVGGLNGGTYTVTVTLGSCSAIETLVVPNEAVAPNIAVTGSPALCGQNTGLETVTATGGESPYKYKWNTSATTATISNLVPGTYTVTVTGANFCTATANVTILNNTVSPTITGVITDNTSCTTANGAIDVSVTPAGNYTYQWNNSATTQDLSAQNSGTFTVTVILGTNCTASAIFMIDQNTTDPIITAAVTPDICSQNIGGIDLTMSGASGPYIFNWSNSAATEDLSSIPAGNYTVSVTAANGCTATQTNNVPNNSSTFSISGTTTPRTLCSTPNGAVNLTITPAGSYGIAWSNSTVTEDLNNLTAGTYTVTITQSGSCTASASFIVLEDLPAPFLTTTSTPEVCGLGNGGIDLSVSNGITPYMYAWSNTSATEDLNAQAAGTYTVTVTGANTCTVTTVATIPANSISFSLSGTTATNTACAVNNGAIDLTATPSGTYTFIWSNMATTEDLNVIPGGSYAVTVSAGGICTNVATFNVDDNTLSPIISEGITPALCGRSNGAINLTISGSTTPYLINWSNSSNVEDQINIPGGAYSVTIQGANGCSSVKNFNVPDNAFAPVATAVINDNTSCTAPNGNLTLSVTPTDTYTYVWDSGLTTATLSNLNAGTYTVTVSAGGACTAVTNFDVFNDTQAPTVTAVLTPSLCSQPVGAVNVSVTGASTPYTFQWSNSSVVEDLSGLLAGTYTVTVTAANNCTTTASFVVDNESNNFAVTEVITPNRSCAAPNGSINLTATPAGTYTYKWSNSALTEDVSGLAAGTYTVTITDAAACAITQVYVVMDQIQAVQLTPSKTDILCFGQSAGSVSVIVNTGTPPYTYTWSLAQPGNPSFINMIPAGTYTVTVKDGAGCTAIATQTVTQPATGMQIQCAATKTISMPGASDGAGRVTINGGTPPYSVTWSPGSTTNNVSSGAFDITDLSEGSYAVTVTDASGCTLQCGFNIGLVNCVTTVGSMSNTLLSKCGTGCITATYSNIGQFLEPGDVFQYILHTGTNNQVVGEIARSATPTFCFDPTTMTYGVTYRISAVAGNNDGNGNVLLSDFCTVVSIGTPIVFQEQPQVTIAPPEVLNCIRKEADLIGTATLANATYGWNTLSAGLIIGDPSQAAIKAGAAGTYRLIVTANTCKDTAIVQVLDLTNAPKAVIQASPDDILDCKIDEIVLTGSIEATNTANAIWISAGVVYSTTNPVVINQPGMYEFVILDTISFCSDTARITIDENQAFPPLFVNPVSPLTCAQPQVTLSGGSPFSGILFRWATINGTDTTFISNGPTTTVSAAGTYYLVGVDPSNACKNAEDVVVVSNQVLPIADAGTPFSIDCFGETVVLDASASSGAPPLGYSWSTQDGVIVSGGNSATPTINTPGLYTLTVTIAASGCTASDDILISPEAPVPTLAVVQPPCEGDKGRIEITGVTGGAPPVSFSVNGAPYSTQTVYANLQAGDYEIRLQDAKGCLNEVAVTINAPGVFEITLEPDATVRLGESYLINVNTNVSFDQIGSVQWQPSTYLSCDTCLQTISTPLEITRYEVLVTSINGCEERAGLLLRVDKRLDIYVPNVFTPDIEGPNNRFSIFADPALQLKIKSFQVYSRWGERVFEQRNIEPNLPALGWDGTLDGKPLNPAVFVWYAVIIALDGNEILLSGDVTLQR